MLRCSEAGNREVVAEAAGLLRKLRPQELLQGYNSNRFCQVALEPGLASQVATGIGMQGLSGQRNDTRMPLSSLIPKLRGDAIGVHTGKLQADQYYRG